MLRGVSMPLSVLQGLLCLYCVLAIPRVSGIKQWNMHDYCGRNISDHGGELYFNADLLPFGQKSCSVTVTGKDIRETKVSFFFSNFDMGNDCNRTSMGVIDGPADVQSVNAVPGLGPKICGTNQYHNINQVFTTSNRYLGVIFEGDRRLSAVNATFTITFASYMTKDSGCSEDISQDLYICGNGRCIVEQLTCQDLNPCGDFTSDCYNTTDTVRSSDKTNTAGMSTVLLIFVFGLITVLGVVFLVQMLMLVKRHGRRRCGSDDDSSESDELTDAST